MIKKIQKKFYRFVCDGMVPGSNPPEKCVMGVELEVPDFDVMRKIGLKAKAMKGGWEQRGGKLICPRCIELEILAEHLKIEKGGNKNENENDFKENSNVGDGDSSGVGDTGFLVD